MIAHKADQVCCQGPLVVAGQSFDSKKAVFLTHLICYSDTQVEFRCWISCVSSFTAIGMVAVNRRARGHCLTTLHNLFIWAYCCCRIELQRHIYSSPPFHCRVLVPFKVLPEQPTFLQLFLVMTVLYTYRMTIFPLSFSEFSHLVILFFV